MKGAILGDIIGSTREWKRIKTEQFELFPKGSKITDDTVMTIATADALLNGKSFTQSYHEWGNNYPNAGYGGMFRKWLKSDNPKPYNSFGNGSAMRVSPIGWFSNNIDDVEINAYQSACCTHNHPEGIKGARSIAVAIFMAREKYDKKEIKKYIQKNYDYDLERKTEDIRPNYKFDSTCQGSVPEAIICFLEGNSYEETVRKAISLGGDSDTLACIAGSIAEAYYGIPYIINNNLYKYLPGTMIKIVQQFEKKIA
ncbi:MAG: ADP-ribosylglycohydrolase family protein [Bacilli bacterium]|nr:ADP-ribosylglycohydrolase family protein [Bacilli bacterium]